MRLSVAGQAWDSFAKRWLASPAIRPDAVMVAQLLLVASLLMSLLACLGGGAISQAAAQTASEPKPTPQTMLIFDGSGSMWGKIEGEKQIKLAQARDGVRATLSKFSAAGSGLGLMSFGHRRQADCSDVQIITPIEASAEAALVERLMPPLEKLNPKGKGPLTTALREAAKALGKTAGPRSIVLIHDDADNCQQDACAALAELQQSAPGVVIHVVGLAVKPEDATRYQCLTKPTGGKQVNAQDAAQIAAGIGEVMQLAALGVTETTVSAVSAKPAVAAAAAKPIPAPTPAAPLAAAVDLARDGPPAIRARALLSKERLVTSQRIRWSITSDPLREGQSVSIDVEGSDLIVPVEPGAYRVRATSGLVQADATVSVGAKGQVLAEVVFNASEIRIKAPLAADATVLVAERDPALDRAGRGGSIKPGPAGRRLGVWPHGQTSLLVPARALLLTLEQGELRSVWPVDIAAGEILDVDVGQAGGRVSLDLLPVAGPNVTPAQSGQFGNQPVVYTIEEDDPDAPRGRREIARSAAPVAEFVVAPGTYMVAATRGSLETRERIAVAAGEVVRRSLPLVASRLVISARFGKSAPPASERPLDSFRLTRSGADRETSLVMQGPAAIVDVPPGRYRVEARRNNAAIKAEQEIEIRSGEYKVVALEYQAGELRMGPVFDSNPGQPVAWRILDADGRLVGSGTEADGSQLLNAGRYSVRVDIGGKRREQVVEIKPGEVSNLRLQ